MTKREFLDTVFALAPDEANAIMDAFDEYVDSNEPHWIPVAEEGLPKESGSYQVTTAHGKVVTYVFGTDSISSHEYWKRSVLAWKPLPEPYKGVTE